MVLLLIRAITDTNPRLYTFPNTTTVAMLNLAVIFLFTCDNIHQRKV